MTHTRIVENHVYLLYTYDFCTFWSHNGKIKNETSKEVNNISNSGVLVTNVIESMKQGKGKQLAGNIFDCCIALAPCSSLIAGFAVQNLLAMSPYNQQVRWVDTTRTFTACISVVWLEREWQPYPLELVCFVWTRDKWPWVLSLAGRWRY